MDSTKIIIFVCTSNTCRSPIAEGFAKHWLEKNGVDGFIVESRSLSQDYEPVGSPASAHGVDLMKDIYDIDISRHRSTLLTEDDVLKATYVIGVSKAHTAAISRLFSGCEAKLLALNRDIPDPWHADRRVYEQCAAAIQSCVSDTLATLLSPPRP